MNQLSLDMIAWALIVLGVGVALAALIFRSDAKTMFPHGIGTRALLASIVVGSACYVCIIANDVQALIGMAGFALGFYFGTRQPNGNGATQPNGGPTP